MNTRRLFASLGVWVLSISPALALANRVFVSARSGNESGDGLVWTSTVENVTHNRTGAKLEKEVEA